MSVVPNFSKRREADLPHELETFAVSPFADVGSLGLISSLYHYQSDTPARNAQASKSSRAEQ